MRDSALLNSLLKSAFATLDGKEECPTNTEVARVGLAVAAGEMKYQELLDWILENETQILNKTAGETKRLLSAALSVYWENNCCP